MRSGPNNPHSAKNARLQYTAAGFRRQEERPSRKNILLITEHTARFITVIDISDIIVSEIIKIFFIAIYYLQRNYENKKKICAQVWLFEYPQIYSCANIG